MTAIDTNVLVRFLFGISGQIVNCCFSPKHTTEGFFNGMMQGLQVFDRVLGRSDWTLRTKNVAPVWAGHDGAELVPVITNYRTTGW